MAQPALAMYDFTLKQDDEQYVYTDIIEWLKANCNKYAFQLERSEGGYEHYQGRFSLIKRVRIARCIAMFNGRFKIGHISPTSTNNNGKFSYVMKEPTRIAGPWTDQDIEEEEIYIPIQYRVSLRPWQQALYDLVIKELDDKIYRNVHVLHDSKGGIGKTTFAMSLTCKRMAEYVPPCNDARDIMRMVYSLSGITKARLYVFDLTRSMNKDKLNGMYSAIEQIKNGYLYDDRYTFRRRFIDSPGVIVMTNELPSMDYLSSDRWKVHYVEDDTLKTYEKVDDSDDEPSELDYGLDD